MKFIQLTDEYSIRLNLSLIISYYSSPPQHPKPHIRFSYSGGDEYSPTFNIYYPTNELRDKDLSRLDNITNPDKSINEYNRTL